jgi:filamentous hemagglutinin family protein
VVTIQGNHIAIDGGTQVGGNLFHSFQDFNLLPQETANFFSHSHIDNILGRVVGGNPSVIEGLIRLSGGNSNLYLINPAGMIWGPSARLDLPASFTATSATRLGFEGGFFHSYGDNNYSALASGPNSFIFDAETGLIFNRANLAVPPGESLWLVGSSVLNTGTLRAPGGNVTISAVSAHQQIRISQDHMLLNLVLDAAPINTREVGTQELPDQIGLTSTDIPRYLTGGSDLANANTLTVADDGRVYLTSHGGDSRVFGMGDVAIAGTVAAETVQLMAAGQVTPTDYNLLQGDTTVVRFADQGDLLGLTAIDETVEDYQSFCSVVNLAPFPLRWGRMRMGLRRWAIA